MTCKGSETIPGITPKSRVLVPQGGDVDGAREQIFGLARELFGEEREFVQASYQDMLKLVSTKA
jgi:hypothetical protein